MSDLPDYVQKQALGDPAWEEAEKVHDWRNHVTARVQSIWNTFTDEQKLALADWAEYLSDRENWD